MLDSSSYWYHVVKADDPKQAFKHLVEELVSWNEFNKTDVFVPKRFHLFSDPKNLLEDNEVSSYVKSISNKKIRNNYVVCLFLKSGRFIFYSPLR